MTRSVAVNVAANTNLPGFRGPIYPDGSFAYVPIPEREPVAESVPTYADLGLPFSVPDEVADVPVHLDPEFATYPHCERWTYGDDYGVKARPISELAPGDSLFFYATLSVRRRGADPLPDGDVDPLADGDDDHLLGDDTGRDALPGWMPPDWGAFLIGELRVERVVVGEEYPTLSAEERAPFANNAHVKRDPFDAEVLVLGSDDSRLFDRAVPLSAPDAGVDANRLVTGLSSDSGEGPWWRRPLRFGEAGTAELRRLVDAGPEAVDDRP